MNKDIILLLNQQRQVKRKRRGKKYIGVRLYSYDSYGRRHDHLYVQILNAEQKTKEFDYIIPYTDVTLHKLKQLVAEQATQMHRTFYDNGIFCTHWG